MEAALVRDEVCWEVKVKMGFPIRLSVVTGGVWNVKGFAALSVISAKQSLVW